jgi:sulfhydrogenase subunit beta (sulfur reductase)
MEISPLERPAVVLPAPQLQRLLDVLHGHGWNTIGPRVKDGAIVLAPIQRVTELPSGWTDRQEAGRYRLQPSGDARCFGFNAGPTSAKPYLHTPHAVLWRGDAAAPFGGTPSPADSADSIPKLALIGLHPCDLHALFKLDEVLLRGPYVDALYAERRKQVFLIVVNCTQAGAACFCSSMGGGPFAREHFDLAITELLDDDGHRFLVQAGSRSGDDLLSELPVQPASAADLDAAQRLQVSAEQQMGRQLATGGLREVLLSEFESPYWDEIGARCLGCGNCTSVCPTCFCVTTEDYTSLDGRAARRERRWDSCFTLGFSYIHGGSVRTSAKSRYRQWLLHKLATWHDQFGTAGCVGCGRCITWCPAGIDITVEATAIRDGAKRVEVLDGDH